MASGFRVNNFYDYFDVQEDRYFKTLNYSLDFYGVSVPEPGTWALLGLGGTAPPGCCGEKPARSLPHRASNALSWSRFSTASNPSSVWFLSGRRAGQH